MKNLKDTILEKLVFNKHTKRKYNYHPESRDELEELVNKLIKERGNDADLNDIDTSKITYMPALFYRSSFNGDISNWDVSNVKEMSYMFTNSSFNGDISDWDVRNVEDMSHMFDGSPLEKNPPQWYKK